MRLQTKDCEQFAVQCTNRSDREIDGDFALVLFQFSMKLS